MARKASRPRLCHLGDRCPRQLLTNGGFEQPVGFGEPATIPGWTLQPGTGGGFFEIAGNNIGTPYEGNQFTELNSFAPATISQTVPTVVGQSYTFSFAFSARPGTTPADNDVGVSVNGIPLTTVTADGTNLNNTSWTVYTFTVTATSTSTTLQFASLSPAGDGVGGELDAVQFLPVASGPATPTTTQVVNNPAVIATGGITINAIAGIPTGLVQVASFTDPGGLEPNSYNPTGTIHTHYNATINWGDGSPVTSNATLVVNGNTVLVEGNHTYTTANHTFTITVVITHEAASAVTVTSTANVSGPMADLAVAKTGPASVAAGSNLTYTLTVTNNGPSPAQSVSLSDVVPTGTTFVSAMQNTGQSFTLVAPGVGSTGTVTATTATLASGSTATFTVVVHANATDPTGSSITNTATVSSATQDPNAGNNNATVTTTVTGGAGSADLSVIKSGPQTAAAGSNLTYTITVTNNGPNAAASVSLADVVPTGTTFVSETQTSGPQTFTFSSNPAVGGTGTITGTLASMTSATTAIFQVVVKANANDATGSTILNTATVTTTTTDPNPANNSSTTSTTVTANGASADLAVTKTGPGSVQTGSNLTYTVTVTNNGPNAAQSVSLSDAVPTGTTFVSETQTGGPQTFTFSNPAVGSTGTITGTLASMTSGTTDTFQVVVKANVNDANGSTISNTAVVSAATTDPSAGNNTATVNTTVTTGPSADLSVGVSGPSSALHSSNVTYTITVTNNGPSTATNVVLTDPLPVGTLFVAAAQPAGQSWTLSNPAVGSTGTVTASIASLASGATATFTITVRLPSTSGRVTNTVTVSSGVFDPNAANNTATQTTTVV